MMWFRRNKHLIEDECCGERLSAYIDHELTPEEVVALERHLAECEDCRWNLETLRQTVALTRDCAPVRLPRVFTLPVETAAPQAVRARRPAWGLPLLQGATALVALLFVVVVAGDLFLGGSAPRSAPQMVAVQATVAMDQAVQEVEITQVVMAQVAETVVVEAAVEMPTFEPAAAKALPPEATAVPPSALEMAAPTPTVVGEVVGMGAGEPSGVPGTMEVLVATAEPSLCMRRAATPTATVTLAFTTAMPLLTQLLTVQVTLTAQAAEQAAMRELDTRATASVATYAAATAAPTEHLAPMPTAVPAVETLAPAPVDTADGGMGPGVETMAVAEEAANAAAPAEAPAALSSYPGPTVVAVAPPAVEVEQGDRSGEEPGVVGTLRETVAPWFNTAEIVLGAAFVLLALATAVAMLRWQPR